MNILIKMSEIVIFPPLKHRFDPWGTFLALAATYKEGVT